MSSGDCVIRIERVFGTAVEGEAVISLEGFSPRYDLNRWTGVITKRGHALEGVSIRGKILFFPSAKGGVAAGWAFYDLVHKDIAPRALVFATTNPVMVQGAVFAGICIASGLSRPAHECFRTGQRVRIDPDSKRITAA